MLRRGAAWLLTSPAAFLLAGIIDVTLLAGGGLWAWLRRRARSGRPG